MRRRILAPVLAMLLLTAGFARAADDAPRLPCGTAPLPAYADPGALPNVRAWSGKSASAWVPPACTGWAAAEADMLVAVAGSFRFDGGMDGLLARIGAISAKKGVRYWSTTEQRWEPLVTEAYALSAPDPAQRRADFSAAQMKTGSSMHYAQSDNRTGGPSVYREHLLEVGPERLVATSENLSPLKKMLVTLFEPGAVQTVYFLEQRAPGVWDFYSLTRAHMASALLPTGSEASYINRSVAFYRYVAGIPTDREPPPAR